MLLNECRELMEEICELIQLSTHQIQERRFKISLKPDGTPVTEADIFIENLVLQYLKQRIHNIAFIGEESYKSTQLNEGSYIAILDPIDGTENFCSGLKEWGVSFSLWYGNKHLGSFIFLPEMNIKLMTGDSIETFRSRLTGISSSISEKVIDFLKVKGEYRITGCAVYNIYNVIKGSFARFINPKGAYVWDLLPGLMLALEQGCYIEVNDEVFNGELLNPSYTYRILIKR